MMAMMEHIPSGHDDDDGTGTISSSSDGVHHHKVDSSSSHDDQQQQHKQQPSPLSFFHHPCGAIPYHSSFHHPTLGGRSLWINSGCWGGISPSLSPASSAWHDGHTSGGGSVSKCSNTGSGDSTSGGPSSTRNRSSKGSRLLRDLIFDDVDPELGPRVLLPFLTTQDRLRLSEVCSWLLRYRYNLTHVKITHHNGCQPATTELEHGLIRLLSHQTCVNSLCICHQSALRWVMVLRCFPIPPLPHKASAMALIPLFLILTL